MTVQPAKQRGADLVEHRPERHVPWRDRRHYAHWLIHQIRFAFEMRGLFHHRFKLVANRGVSEQTGREKAGHPDRGLLRHTDLFGPHAGQLIQMLADFVGKLAQPVGAFLEREPRPAAFVKRFSCRCDCGIDILLRSIGHARNHGFAVGRNDFDGLPRGCLVPSTANIKTVQRNI